MSHFCLVVCSAIGRSESRVCIAFVLGIIVTTPEVHVSGILPTWRKFHSVIHLRFEDVREPLEEFCRETIQSRGTVAVQPLKAFMDYVQG